eukprot:5948392-Amphidinium_carterae.1
MRHSVPQLVVSNNSRPNPPCEGPHVCLYRQLCGSITARVLPRDKDNHTHSTSLIALALSTSLPAGEIGLGQAFASAGWLRFYTRLYQDQPKEASFPTLNGNANSSATRTSPSRCLDASRPNARHSLAMYSQFFNT